MVYAINAISCAWIASFWSKTGGWNIVIALMFVLIGFINAALSAPFVYQLVRHP